MDETLVHRPPEEKRLNPFAFPAETNVRFTLLVFALLMITIDLSQILIGTLSGGSTSPLDLAGAAPEITVGPTDPAYAAQAAASLAQALGNAALSVAVLAAIIGLILGAAYLLYRAHPARLRRARRLRPFPPGKDAKFTGEVDRLAHLAGVSPAPSIEMGEKSPPADGQVFGFKGRYTLRLGTRMPLVMRKLPPIFEGTVLHEMAHIVNGDVGRTYFAQSLWTAVLILLLAPTALVYIGVFAGRLVDVAYGRLTGSGGDLARLVTVNTPIFIWVMIRIAGLAALLSAIRGSLLRVREVYADWRAALWGAGDGLKAIFRENQGQGKPAAWSRLWRLHPEPRERLRLLENPRALFAIAADLPLLVGALVGAAASGFLLVTIGIGSLVTIVQTYLAAVLLQGNAAMIVLGFLIDALWNITAVIAVAGPMLALTYLTAGTLGLQSQRDAVAEAAMQERRGCSSGARLIFPAALYALGMQIGFVLAPVNFFAPIDQLAEFKGNPTQLALIPPAMLAWWLVTTALVWLWLMWGSSTARRWMSRKTGPIPPDRRRRFLTFYLAIILWPVLITALIAQSLFWDALMSRAGIPAEFGIPVIAVGLTLAAVAAVVGWLLVVALSSGPVKCPVCGRKTDQRAAVGRSCEHCGADLAAWIIAQPRGA